MIDTNNKLKSLSRSLLEAAQSVMTTEAKKVNKHGHDPVGKEDADIDNDGDTDKSDSYLHNRRKAIGTKIKLTKGWGDGGKSMKAHAGKTMREESEQIDELSRKTMASYVSKASKSKQRIDQKRDDIDNARRAVSHITVDDNTHRNALDNQLLKVSNKLYDKSYNRKDGMHRALKKLAKEEVETVDEMNYRDSGAQNMLRSSMKADRIAAKDRAAREKAKMTKEEVELEEAMNAADRYTQHHAAVKDLIKSIGQHLDAHKKDAMSNTTTVRDYVGRDTGKSHKGPHWGHVGDLANVHSQLADIHDRLAQKGEYSRMHESVELDEAPVDGVAPGSMDNDGHLCATKVMHREWNEGTPIHSQHAEPDADGHIAWYDVMFEHGIEKMVATDEMEVLMSEMHGSHKRKKMKEDTDLAELSRSTLGSYASKALKDAPTLRKAAKRYSDVASDTAEEGDVKGTKSFGKLAAKALQKSANRMAGVDKAINKMSEETELDEARGRPRKNPLPAADVEPEPRLHIMQQLQRAKLSMRGGEHVSFKDGTKHHIPGEHAAKILTKYAGMKPSEKEDFQKKIGASHAAFKEEL